MLHLIWKSYTDEGFGRNVYKHVFFLSTYIYTYIYIVLYLLNFESSRIGCLFNVSKWNKAFQVKLARLFCSALLNSGISVNNIH